MFNRLKKINKNQKGFTLIELIVVIAITGLIISAITVTIFQLFSISARSDSHMLAVRQVQNAGYWISHDTQMAQSVETDGGTTGFPLKLTWSNEWDSNTYEVVYNLVEADGKLKRSYKVNDDDPSEMLVAEYIDTDNTNCEFNDTDGDGNKDTLFLKVTATVSGRHEATETRVYEVIPRPDQ